MDSATKRGIEIVRQSNVSERVKRKWIAAALKHSPSPQLCLDFKELQMFHVKHSTDERTLNSVS